MRRQRPKNFQNNTCIASDNCLAIFFKPPPPLKKNGKQILLHLKAIRRAVYVEHWRIEGVGQGGEVPHSKRVAI